MAHNALYLAGMGWNKKNLVGNPGAMEPGFYQKAVNEAMFGYYGFWWPLFLDYNEAREADNPNVRHTVTKEAVTLVFREFSYTEDRPGLNGETSGLVKFYMPLDKAIKQVLTFAGEEWRWCFVRGTCVLPGEEGWPDPAQDPAMAEALPKMPGACSFFKSDDVRYSRPWWKMLDFVPPVPGAGVVRNESFDPGSLGRGGLWVRAVKDSAGGVLRPQFTVGPDEPPDDPHFPDENYNYTYLQQGTQFAQLWPPGISDMINAGDHPTRTDLINAIVDSDDEAGEYSFLGYGTNILGSNWSQLPWVDWVYMDDVVLDQEGIQLPWGDPLRRAPVCPPGINFTELQSRANRFNLWTDLIEFTNENYADWLAREMTTRTYGYKGWWEGAEVNQVAPDSRGEVLAAIEGCPVPDYIIEGNTIYDWMQWASAMAGGWPDIGERHRRHRLGLRATLARGDIGPDTIVRWRGSNWKIAGDDEEARMANVRWLTAPPTDDPPEIMMTHGWHPDIPEDGPGIPRAHAGRPYTGAGWETLKRWRRLIPPPAVPRPGGSVGSHFGAMSIDYGILLTSELLEPGIGGIGKSRYLFPADSGGYGFYFADNIDRLGGPIPTSIKPMLLDISVNPLRVWNGTQQSQYLQLLREQNPQIFFEKFNRPPVWEDACPEVDRHVNAAYLKNWPMISTGIDDPEGEKWKQEALRQGKKQIVIPPLFSWHPDGRAVREWKQFQLNGNQASYPVQLSFNKSIRPGIPSGPTDGIGWDYREPGGNLAGIHWSKPQLREVVATTFTQNEQGAPAGAARSALVNFPPWEGTPPWYLALTNYSDNWAIPYPIDNPWVANPPLWLMPAPPSYALELMSGQWPDPMSFGPPPPPEIVELGGGDPRNFPEGVFDFNVGITGATASQAFLAMLEQSTGWLGRQVGFRGLQGVFSPD